MFYPLYIVSSHTLSSLVVGISGFLFIRNRAARSARLAKIDKEYALGDLRATFRGVRSSYLRDLRGKFRVVAIVGSREFVEGVYDFYGQRDVYLRSRVTEPALAN